MAKFSTTIEVFTLGTFNRSIDEFLEILKNYKIEVVIDVRRWLTSKYFPHFKKENLERILKENNIEYLKNWEVIEKAVMRLLPRQRNLKKL